MLNCLHRFPVQKGDLWFVAGGVPHAIGSGCFMIELQEPSDLMVIPERVTPSGVALKDEKLHGGLGFEKMHDCYVYNGLSAEETRAKYCRRATARDNEMCSLVDASQTEKFAMKQLNVSGDAYVDLADVYGICVMIAGEGTIEENGRVTNVAKGDRFFIPANTGNLAFHGNLSAVFCLPV